MTDSDLCSPDGGRLLAPFNLSYARALRLSVVEPWCWQVRDDAQPQAITQRLLLHRFTVGRIINRDIKSLIRIEGRSKHISKAGSSEQALGTCDVERVHDCFVQ